MKKLFTLIMALVAVLSAGATERTLNLDLSQYGIYDGQGSYDNTNYVITPNGTWKGGGMWLGQEDATNYNQIVLELAEASSVPTYVYVEYTQLQEGSETAYEKGEFTIAAGDTKNSIDLAYNKIIQKIEIKCGGTYVDDATIKLKSLYFCYSDNAIEKATSLYSGEAISFDSEWNTGKSIEPSLFASCKAGDIVRVHVSAITGSGTWSTVALCNGKWAGFDPEVQLVLMGKELAPMYIDFTLTEDMVNIIKGNTTVYGGICMRGANYSLDEISLISSPSEGVDLTQSMNTWDSEYVPSTKTITWSKGWGGAGWWYNDKDFSDYTKIVYEFDGEAPAAGCVEIQYVSGDAVDKGFEANATTAEAPFDVTRMDHVKAIYLRLYDTGSITLKNVYLVNAYTEDRTTATGSYGTICLPYDATATGAILMQCAGRTENSDGIVFNYAGETAETSTALKAGVPYLYRATADAQSFRYDKSAEAVAATPVNTFTGVYTGTNVAQGYYFLYLEDNTIHPSNGNVTCAANHCYLNTNDITTLPVATTPKAKSAMFFGLDGAATAINAVDANAEAKAQDGKFIQNGQIVIVKNGKKFNAAGAQVK